MNLRLTGLLLAGATLCITASAATTVQTFFFDFGPNNVANRGNITPEDAPDANGNYWNNIHSTSGNNITAGSAFSTVRNAEGTAVSGMNVTVNGQFNTNGLSGGGGLLAPDAALLGDLAVATATQDYMFLDGNNVDNRAFTISGLDPDHAYTFGIFTSRKANDTRTGRFTVEGYNTFVGENQAAGSGIGAAGENQNTSVILATEPVFPTPEGTIKITVSRVTGQYIPLNCMKMTELSGVARPVVDLSDRRFFFDFGATPQGANKCETTPSPDINGNWWNNLTNTSDGSKYAAAGTVYDSLTDSEGNAATLTVTLNDRFSTNGMSGGGGLLTPDATQLGDLAIATATSDYFFYEADQTDCSMTFGGLDADKAYRFHIFASRKATDNRTGNYQLSGYNIWGGTLQAAGTNLGGDGVNQNNSSILVSDYMFADADGNIKLTVKRASGTYIPLNCMKIEEFSGIERPVLNDYVSVTLAGTAADGRTVSLTRTTVDGKAINTYTGVADFATGEFTLAATDADGATYTIGRAEADGKLALNGTPFAATGVPAILSFDLDAMTYTLTPIENIRIIGSAVGSWSLTDYKEMTYAGNLVYTWEGTLEGHDTSTDSGRIGLYINGGWTAFKRTSVDADYNAVLSLGNGADIPVNPGSYRMTFNLGTGVFHVENGLDDLDTHRITVFGSSVANGQGADQIDNENHGYIHLYGKQLAERHASGESENPFYMSNISIGGNSTVMLLDRYDDMRREFGKYVIFGVSLGNEGIHGAPDQPAVYSQFKTNMLRLIDMVRADGKIPVVCNNYTRGDFTGADYEHVVSMDREIGLWDVPSINLLGAIDSKTGLWADGYQNGTDIYHPNQQGHQEFAYAMVPSMFDALQSGKALVNERLAAPGTALKEKTLTAVPEGTMHSFSLVLVGNTDKTSGKIAHITLADGSVMTLSHDGDHITLTAGDRTLTADAGFNTPATLVALNYTYASRILDLDIYHGATFAATARMTDVALEPTEFTLPQPDITLNEMMLYRSALSAADVESLAAGELQKGSLEIYSVFVPEADNGPAAYSETLLVENHAMSLNAITMTDNGNTSITEIDSTAADNTVRYFTPDGIEATRPAKGNLYIAVGKDTVSKIIY